MPVSLDIDAVSRQFGGERRLFAAPKPVVHAVQGISLQVQQGETLGIVGESGCGKSTLARMLVGLLPPSRGQIRLGGEPLQALRRRAPLGQKIQYVFQDPISSLNPRKTIAQSLGQTLRQLRGLKGPALQARMLALFETVSLRPEFLSRYPHEFSGGQAQRIGIARALAAEPELMVLDEPVSALDVSVQAQVLNLLADLKAQYRLTYLFISHDLTVVESVSDRIAVLYFGRLIELGPADAVFSAPRHPYTQLLADSAPALGKPIRRPEQDSVELPDPLKPPSGCAFAGRCPRAQGLCQQQVPPLRETASDRQWVACHFPLDST